MSPRVVALWGGYLRGGPVEHGSSNRMQLNSAMDRGNELRADTMETTTINTTATTTATTATPQDGHVDILTLGDGDFSFSADLARHLADATSLGLADAASICLTATGIDSKEEVLAKYKDSLHLLGLLRSAATTGSDITSPNSADGEGIGATTQRRLQINVVHNINAAYSQAGADAQAQAQSAGPSHEDPAHDRQAMDPTPNLPPADHVIFNHPHLGTEDAALHMSFLSHLFYAADKHFMKKSTPSFYHLTLVDGQFDRWKCLDAAHKQGLQLVHRCVFRPPHIRAGGTDAKAKNGGSAINYYQHRRHQTGKSFESRSTGSETFTFCRKSQAIKLQQHRQHQVATAAAAGDDRGVNQQAPFLPWSSKTETYPSANTNSKQSNTTKTSKSNDAAAHVLQCPHCDKQFKEKRSLKCHVRDRHSRKRDRPDDPKILCPHCPEREFQSQQALEDHCKAKHWGNHSNIKPDWFVGSSAAIPTKTACPICHVACEDVQRHLRCFIPSTVGTVYSCTFCHKSFRERRGQLQHENFCDKRQK